MKPFPRLLLASQSPRRRKILRFAGIPFQNVKFRGVVEDRKKGENPSQMVRRLAFKKAMTVARRFPKSWVLGADTVVVCRGQLFGKPRNPAHAEKMLQQLQGRSHVVWTGVALVGKGGRTVRSSAERTTVFFRKLSKRELKKYLNSKEPYDKAGAYDIQGTARGWVEKWKGDYFNVMGLPLRRVIEEINRLFSRSGKS